MPWPKGQKRIGYIKKDGSAHAKKGQALHKSNPRRQPAIVVVKPVEVVAPGEKKAIWGVSTQAVIEPCPNCRYAYADAGWCPECGFTKFVSHCPHCRKAA